MCVFTRVCEFGDNAGMWVMIGVMGFFFFFWWDWCNDLICMVHLSIVVIEFK